MQIQAAMGLPMRRVSLSREAVYSILAWLKRHRARTSPRAMRFELLPDKPPALVLEPWEQRIVSHGTTYQGPPGEPIRIWGTRRLLVLARLLPLAERFDVYLLGTGFPELLGGAHGRDAADAGALGLDDQRLDPRLGPGSAGPARRAVARRWSTRLAELAAAERKATFDEVQARMAADPGTCAAALNHLAHAGQVIYDLAAGVYRWRQVMPMAVGEAEIGPENAELAASRTIVGRRQVRSNRGKRRPRRGHLRRQGGRQAGRTAHGCRRHDPPRQMPLRTSSAGGHPHGPVPAFVGVAAAGACKATRGVIHQRPSGTIGSPLGDELTTASASRSSDRQLC